MADKEDFLAATLGASDLVYNFARRLVRDRGAAEDLVQETYLRAFESWGRHRRPEHVEAWLAAICLNLARSQYRRRRSRPQELLQADAGSLTLSGADTAGEALAAMDREVLHAALWDLPEDQRVAITLMDLCGMSASEVARATRTPRGSVLSRVRRGRSALAGKVGMQVRIHEP